MSEIFRDQIFAGRTAFFTGGTSGIGLRLAERFAGQGARIALFGRNEEKLGLAVRCVQNSGAESMGFAGDVRNYDALAAALRRTREAWDLIDILVCAAAGNFPAPVTGMSANGFKAVVDIDLLGTFNACRAAHEHLRKPGASIISISANHAHQPYAWQSHVCAAKAGVDLLTRTIALEWGADGIRANCITPGPVDDTEGMRRLAPSEDARAKVIRHVPLGRMGSKDDIANLALFLCSDAASYITGGVYVCDGGQSLAGPRSLSDALSER